MEPPALLDALADLARACDFEVRDLGRGAPADGIDAPSQSGVCRLAGKVWVLFAPTDPPEARIDLLARALQRHAGPALADRYLAPAVRARLERVADES